ncbi:hypothetical protein ABZ490_46205 [Streptomyces sp. NPDC005811]|uniref:hypothetical protein n=1 Tax=Streptomyces sp. NPDC005811 TaxID=3154565 RepID=UPI0033DE2343
MTAYAVLFVLFAVTTGAQVYYLGGLYVCLLSAGAVGLDGCLGLLGPGRLERQAQQYFTELILLAGLVTICLPRIQPVGTTRPLATAVDRRLAIHDGVDSRAYRSNAAPSPAPAYSRSPIAS